MNLLTPLRSLVIISLTLGVTQIANAKVYPYVGVEANTFQSDFESKPTMVGVVGGVQFSDVIGVEATWSQSTNKMKVNEDSPEGSKLTMYGANVTFQAELGRDFYAKSSLGYAQLKSDLDKEKQNLGVVKVGAGYQFTPDLAAEVMYIHTEGSKKDFEALKGGVGVQVKFYF